MFAKKKPNIWAFPETRSLRFFIFILFPVFILSSCASNPKWQPFVTDGGGAFPAEHWQKVDRPEQLGWSSKKLLTAQAYSKKIGSAAVMIIDDGIVVDAWGNIAKKYKCHSMRKSLLSALIGIQVDRNTIDLSKTMEELEIEDYPPKLTFIEKQATVADLIKARSGIYHPALGEADVMKALRPKRCSHPPGTFWYYNNWDFNALGTIYEKETGIPLCEDFERLIAIPLQMEDFESSDCLILTGENPEKRAVSQHPYYFFRMSARDLARFGLLYMREGKWGDRKIVSKQWVQDSTTSHSARGADSGYGYMWWTGLRGGLFPNVWIREHSYYASGYRGHRIIVLPYRKLVIVHRVDTNRTKGYVDDRQIGRLLWLILNAAGETEIGEEPSLSKASGDRLGERELAEIFRKSTVQLQGTTPPGLVQGQGGKSTHLTCSTDGSFSLFVGGSYVETGKWWIEGDTICVNGREMTRGRPFCGFLVLEGSTLKVFDQEETRSDVFHITWDVESVN